MQNRVLLRVPKKVLTLLKVPKIVPKKVLFPKKVPKKVLKKALEAVGTLYVSEHLNCQVQALWLVVPCSGEEVWRRYSNPTSSWETGKTISSPPTCLPCRHILEEHAEYVVQSPLFSFPEIRWWQMFARKWYNLWCRSPFSDFQN